MNKVLLWFFVMVLGSLSSAQQQPEAPPTQPARLPSTFSWNLVYEQQAVGVKTPDVPSDPQTVQTPEQVIDEFPVRLRVAVTKMNDMRRELVFWSSDVRTETWFVKGYYMQQIPTWPADQMIFKRAGAGGGAPDVSQTDFPELAWISAETYHGLAKRGKAKCFYFKTTDGDEAWLDSESLRPVAARNAEPSAWTYEYAGKPEAGLVLPKLFADRLIPIERRLVRYEEVQKELELQKMRQR